MALWFYNKFKFSNALTDTDIAEKPDASEQPKSDISDVYVPRYVGNFIKKRATRINKYSPNKNITSVYDSSSRKKIKKAIVLDLDETIGSFTELFFIWNSIRPEDYSFYRDKTLFVELAKLYPETLRPGMIGILKYIYDQIREGNCYKLHIYTNNQCTYPEWIQLLIYYLDTLVHNNTNFSIFEKPICAFKINDCVIEHKRTCHSKTHADLIRCSILPQSAEICFIDDTKFEKMINERVYYIQPPPYRHTLTFETMSSRFAAKYSSPFPSSVKKQWFSLSSKNNSKMEMAISKKILYYIREFFMMQYKNRDTKKIRIKLGKFTRKCSHNIQK